MDRIQGIMRRPNMSKYHCEDHEQNSNISSKYFRIYKDKIHIGYIFMHDGRGYGFDFTENDKLIYTSMKCYETFEECFSDFKKADQSGEYLEQVAMCSID